MSLIIAKVTDHCEAISLVDVIYSNLPEEPKKLKAAYSVIKVSVDSLESREGLKRMQGCQFLSLHFYRLLALLNRQQDLFQMF
jgi:hypothetical protein